MSHHVQARFPGSFAGARRKRNMILGRILPGVAVGVAGTLLASTAVSAQGLDDYEDDPTAASANVAGMTLDS